MQNETIRQAYADHLSRYYWDTYATVTFKRTRRDGTNAVSAVWDRLPFAPTRGFFAVEKHKLDGIHLHALLHHPIIGKGEEVHNDIPKRTQAYLTATFGWSKCEWVNGQNGVSDYCAKYITKGNDYFYKGMPQYWQPM